MQDLPAQVDPIRDIQPEQDRRRRVAWSLLVVLLLLLLLCICSTWTGSVIRTTPERVRWIADNRTCLQCHTELLPQFNMAAVHNPFERKSCTTCHTDHGALFMKEASPSRLWILERCGVVVTWEPLKRAIDRCGQCGWTSDLGRREGAPRPSEEGTETGARKKSELTAPMPTLCFRCHPSVARLVGKKYEHNPFAKGLCTRPCHRPHASDNAWLLVSPTRQLCPSCHRLAEDLALPDRHPPFEARQCTSCHQPHASDFEGIIRLAQKQLCFSCHPQIAQLTNLPVQHSPFMNGKCTGCHKPHSSTARPLLISHEPSLCYSCHPGIRNDFLKPSHHPVGTPLLNCTDCHGPHATLYRRLLVAKNNLLCYTCHGDKQYCYDRSAHNKAQLIAAPGLCVNCHTPHGSIWAPLLIKEEMATCLQCHPTKISRVDLLDRRRPKPGSGGYDHDNHPVGDGWRDPLKKRRLTCTSSCHDPHGTCQLAMLRQLPDKLCLACHDVKKLP